MNYAIQRHYPQIQDHPEKALAFLEKVLESQVKLVARWMGVGFIHGVMNTDNTSISGETIDFGPCAFMDEFNFDQVYSFIDKNGRYAYGNQPKMIMWNLSRLADALIPLVDADEKVAIEKLNQVLQKGNTLFQKAFHEIMAKKLGFEDISQVDELINLWFEYLQSEKLDFTLAFRNLIQLHSGDRTYYPETQTFKDFCHLWKGLNPQKDLIKQNNPLYIPRNHLVEKAIQDALKGDYQLFHKMNQLLASPFEKQPDSEIFEAPPKTEEKIKNTFCGT